jgi:hypothetical protein
LPKTVSSIIPTGVVRGQSVIVSRTNRHLVSGHNQWPLGGSFSRGLRLHIASRHGAVQIERMSKELVFHVEQDEEMLVAICHEPEMATQGENLEALIAMVRDVVRCRFDEGDERLKWPIRLHFLQDPVLATQAA